MFLFLDISVTQKWTLLTEIRLNSKSGTRMATIQVKVWTKLRYKIFTSLLMFTCEAMLEISCPSVNMLQIFACISFLFGLFSHLCHGNRWVLALFVSSLVIVVVASVLVMLFYCMQLCLVLSYLLLISPIISSPAYVKLIWNYYNIAVLKR